MKIRNMRIEFYMYRKMLFAYFVLNVLTINITLSQGNQFSLPQILPASPEPSAFMKANLGNINMSIGAATSKIPLYEIKINNFSFPLSLAYSTSGLKADEASSRVGLGWILNATGMITRSVRGAPDEFAQRLTPPADFSNTDAAFYYSLAASDPQSGSDSQPDEFQFSFNGYSGKFILDNNYVPRVTSTSNLKIDVQISVTPGSTSGYIGLINITTPDGVRYQFGNAYEITVSHNIAAYNWYQNVTKTAFFLDRIDLPTGENIVFNYGTISNRAATGITQELKIGQSVGTVNCGTCSDLNQFTTQYDQIYFNSRYLTNITTSNGQVINLDYEARPDLSYDNRVKNFTVQGIKKYVFSYYDVAGSSSQITGRYFLTKLQVVNINTTISTEADQNYLFQYNGMSSVPLPITFQQDYLGYYNGSAYSYLVPPSYNANNGTSMDFGFRNVSFDNAKLGTLDILQYPTGGEDQFIYEANTQRQISLRNTFSNVSLAGVGTNTYTSANFTIPKDQAVTVNTYAADAILNDGYTAPANAVTVSMWIYEGTTMIASRSALGYTNDVTSVNLFAGHTYHLVMHVNNATEIGYCTLSYDYSATPLYDTTNAIFPGVRLKQIRSVDPISLSSQSRYFKYASLGSMNYSSGSCSGVIFGSSYTLRKYCGTYYGQLSTDCMVTTYSSSSTSDVYNYAGSGNVYSYSTVIESDDPNFKNGGTEYTFYDNDNGQNSSLVIGSSIPNLSSGQFPTLSGVILRTRKFDSNMSVVQDNSNIYETLIDLSTSVSSYYVRKRSNVVIALPDRMDAFDVYKSLYGNYWIRIKADTVKNYALGNLLQQQTTYSYGNASNIAPSVITSSDSKNRVTRIEKKYPTDFVGTSVYNTMISRNIIDPIVQQNTYIDTVLLLTNTTNYSLWGNNIVSPQNIMQKKSTANYETYLQFNNYDANGRILEQQRSNDVKEVYLWSYNNTYPVAKIVGSDYATVMLHITQPQIDAVVSDDNSMRGVLNGLRLSLPTAMVETYTYKPFVGITSKTDPAGRITYFEYDGFNRLKIVRDQFGNIIKDYSYKFSDISNGSTVTPIYLSAYQLGNFQRNNCTVGLTGTTVSYIVPAGAYFSLLSQADADSKAASDISLNGQNYANLNGICSNCAATCTGVSNKCVNGLCEAGIKVYTSSIYNSATNNYTCTYHYEWSDGIWSTNYTETSATNCTLNPTS